MNTPKILQLFPVEGYHEIFIPASKGSLGYGAIPEQHIRIEMWALVETNGVTDVLPMILGKSGPVLWESEERWSVR